MIAGVRTARPMLLVAAALLVAWGLGLNVPHAEAGGIHLLLIAAIAVALVALMLGAGSSAAVAPASPGVDPVQVAPPARTSFNQQ